MSLIINIDTATTLASVSLAENGIIINTIESNEQKKHASFVQPAIASLLSGHNKKIKDLHAVAVTIGPGSYTGLRVGLASAKGICYALNIPLITVSTLKVMADGVDRSQADFFCPMIDARRMEVFTAVYDKKGELQMEEQAMILSENSFERFFEAGTVVFLGDGAEKWKKLTAEKKKALFLPGYPLSPILAILSFKMLQQKMVADLAYTEPVYLKGFNT